VCVSERERNKYIKINIRMYARVSVSTLCRLALVTHNTHTHSVPQEVNHHTPSSVS